VGGSADGRRDADVRQNDRRLGKGPSCDIVGATGVAPYNLGLGIVMAVTIGVALGAGLGRWGARPVPGKNCRSRLGWIQTGWERR
jgi:hypothetical protein